VSRPPDEPSELEAARRFPQPGCYNSAMGGLKRQSRLPMAARHPDRLGHAARSRRGGLGLHYANLPSLVMRSGHRMVR
jgi:hypothetical protein